MKYFFGFENVRQIFAEFGSKFFKYPYCFPFSENSVTRKFQMKLIRLTVLIQMIIGIRIFMLFNKFEVVLNNFFLFLMAFTLIALIMAYRGVKKDDDLVRSVDRIR